MLQATETSPTRSQANQKKVITRDTYEELLRLADDGCPLVLDLENYEVVDEDDPLVG